ncbi:MAG: diguanylate cyclase [Myxococcota bacterium]
MSWVRAVLTIRRSLREGPGFLAAGLGLALLLLGVFSRPPRELGVEHALAAAGFAAVLAGRLNRRHGFVTASRSVPSTLDAELGVLLLVAVHALVQLLGGLESEAYPLVLVAIAGVAAFARPPLGPALVALAMGTEVAVHLVTEGRSDALRPLLVHLGYAAVFGALHLVFTRAEIVRVREQSAQALEAERQRVADESRLFRLASATESTEVDEERLYRSSVEAVHHQVFHALQLLRRTLGLHTCVLLARGDDGRLRIAELASASEHIAAGPFPAGEGAVGAALKRQATVNLQRLRPGYGGLCYYEGPAEVRSFLAVPVEPRPGQPLEGVLCADRLEDRPFTPGEQAIFEDALGHVLRAVENERVFVQLERSKREQTVLHHASMALGAARTEAQVLAAGLDAAAQIVRSDLAAITRYDPTVRRHTLRLARGEGAEKLRDLTFKDNASLTAMAVRNRHFLPYRGDFDAGTQMLFTRRSNPTSMASALVLPLVSREEAGGALVLAAKAPGVFGGSVRPTLEVLANQLAVALANADAVRRLEAMATTDGLTGCLNKRAFLEELERKLRAAQRFGTQLSLVVTDIDHFKSVNDTYGHATGDVVIKELGALLRRAKRETDVVARFGGEEFCVLCEQTDTAGAVLLAERIREEFAATVFPTEHGDLQVTCSLGVATFPDHAGSAGNLFEVTDKALYAAKHGGRDQVVALPSRAA